MELQTIDALRFVKTHPGMYFRDAIPSPLPCIKQLVAVALAEGALDVAIVRFADWWVFTSTFDWFGNIPATEHIHRIIAVPKLGDNEQQAEIVLAAFADALATRRASAPWERLTGTAPLPNQVAEHPGTPTGRSLAFLFPMPAARTSSP